MHRVLYKFDEVSTLHFQIQQFKLLQNFENARVSIDCVLYTNKHSLLKTVGADIQLFLSMSLCRNDAASTSQVLTAIPWKIVKSTKYIRTATWIGVNKSLNFLPMSLGFHHMNVIGLCT